MAWDRTKRPLWLRCTIGVLVAVIAAAVRWQFLGVLEFRFVFITFYPAVAVAALYGGLAAGLLTTVVSAALANYFWIEPAGRFAIRNISNLIGISVFLTMGALISYLAEATYRAQTRAHKAEEQSRLAAEREKAAVELQQTESKYRELVQNANSAIIRWKRDGTIAFFNEYAQKLFGYGSEEAVGKHVSMLAPERESTGGSLTEMVQSIVSHPERHLNNINENVLRDGSRVWMAWTNKPIFNVNGEVTEILTVGTDITEAKKREEELLRLNLILRAISNTNQAAVHAKDESDFLRAVCQIIVEDCGRSMVWIGFAEDDENKTVRPVAQAGFEEGYLETIRITWSDIEPGRGPTGTAIRTGAPDVCRNMQTEPRMQPWREQAIKRGYASSVALPLKVDGKTVGALTIYSKDIDSFSDDEVKLLTELADDLAYGITLLRLRLAHRQSDQRLRESQARLDLALRSAGMGTWHWDIIENRRCLDDQACYLLGIDPQMFTGAAEQFFNAVHPDDRETIRAALSRTIEKDVTYETEYRAVWPDGSVHYISTRGKLVHDGKGEPVRLNGLIWDTTERRQLEDEIRRSRDELEMRVRERTAELSATVARLELLNQELQEFAHVASHDLQEPLRKIQTFCDMAMKRLASSLDPTAQQYLDKVVNSASRMRDLLHDLLEFSKVATSPEPLKKIELDSLVREAANVFEASVKETGCRIEIESLPAIEADESQMLQLFQNLIGNALKFHSDLSPHIRVYGKSESKGTCEIRVEDNGIGFDRQFAELIFRPFQRLHGRSLYEGTGMGLAICRKIVERHGGTIRAEGKPGKGSTFIIRLPVKQTRPGSAGSAGKL